MMTFGSYFFVPPFHKGGSGGILQSTRGKSPSIPLYKRAKEKCRYIASSRHSIASCLTFYALIFSLIAPLDLPAQSKPLRELRVPYALGGSTGFFWVAHRSGSFEKYGLKVLRFRNDDVLIGLHAVCEIIEEKINQITHPNPPLSGRE